MNQRHFRDAKVTVNLNAIETNIKNLKSKMNQSIDVIAVVKADGYGHGAYEVANKALSSGATQLAVALLEEGVELREQGITAPILVMGWVGAEHAPIALKYDLTLTVFQKEWLDEFNQLDLEGRVGLHVKFDTGMGRLGIRTANELNAFLDSVDPEKVHITGLYTHFATADEDSLDYYNLQQERFLSMLEIVDQRFDTRPYTHVGNSAAGMRDIGHLYDGVRFGIGMYGLYPSNYLNEHRPFHLKPALSLTTALTHVKKMEPNEAISYGATYKTEKEEWIGTIPVGYADGIQRRFQGSHVLINGKRMEIVGRVCMDQCMVRLDQHYPLGTEVCLIGKQRNEEITMEEIANHLGTINYEVACLLTTRLPRYFIES
ncbi:alanine racemase [Pelagirhabdus alkalitolerans]|uniref:Alanine racemase n=1 Tax=Pelagirhabdus alkalitolerans TaxID=1612202 RepID=A0A1G6JF18_9BACI|nr:alanine racemase [Pelagirhabdus alkalitolerans]SDC17253.1 alanine racemase [Pelagirhabdus alkalitolerans]